MTTNEYFDFIKVLREKKLEAAKAVTLELLQKEYPEIKEIPEFHLECDTWAVCWMSKDDHMTDRFIVDLRTGLVTYDSKNLSQIIAMCERHPVNYQICQRGDTTIIITWRNDNAAISRYDNKTGKRTGDIAYRTIYNCEEGVYYQQGKSRIYK